MVPLAHSPQVALGPLHALVAEEVRRRGGGAVGRAQLLHQKHVGHLGWGSGWGVEVEVEVEEEEEVVVVAAAAAAAAVVVVVAVMGVVVGGGGPPGRPMPATPR